MKQTLKEKKQQVLGEQASTTTRPSQESNQDGSCDSATYCTYLTCQSVRKINSEEKKTSENEHLSPLLAV